jgi:NAD(P)-dependent dehydrogenase (short-subunit alcohol dehydrogenase family)
MAGLLEGRRILVTGGGSGLGAAICEAVAQAGAHACVGDIDAVAAGRCAQRLLDQGLQAQALGFDVGNRHEIGETLVRVADGGGLDAVINNAGIDVTRPIEELATEDWERVLRVNLTGPFLMAKLALPYLRQSGRGHILNIASTASRRCWPNASVYHASKWGLLGLSHALHAELRGQGVKVTALIAGGMRTPFLLDRFPDIDASTLQDPANVAQAVVFALSTPPETVIPELMVLPMRETSWP